MALARVHTTAADGTFSPSGATAWNASHGVTGATSGGIPYFDGTTSEASSALLAANSLVIGGGAGAAPFTSANLTFGTATGEGLVFAAGTAGSAVSAMSLTQTWDFTTSAIQGVDWTFTDTNSHANTNAFRIRGGASGTTALMSLNKGGTLTAVGGSFGTMNVTSGTSTFNQVSIAAGNGYIFSGRSRIKSSADGIVNIVNNAEDAGASLGLLEMTAPAGIANTARLFTQDSGGKTQLMVIFGSGVAQQLAIEA